MLAVLLLGMAGPAQAADGLPAIPVSSGTSSGPSLSLTPSGTSTSLPLPGTCSTNVAGANYVGVIPYTMNFYGRISCSSPTISESAQATLYFGNGAWEATGNSCSRTTGTCASNGAYSNTIQTLPNMAHDLIWHYAIRLATGYTWIDKGTGSHCRGYGARTLTCDWDVFIRTPIPVVDG
jgi:hypothetical protein